jgi:hypothetical protein
MSLIKSAMIGSVLALAMLAAATGSAAGQKAPLIYSTDLFHPADDPDDTFDLATMFALTEFDVRAIVLDNAKNRQETRLGRPPLDQMMAITGRKVRYAVGLSELLTSAEDKGEGQPAKYQGGVEMILSCLRESAEPVTLFETGSCRDFAAAFNRDPDLFRRKVKALYCVTGTGGQGEVPQKDWNVMLDPWAYFRMFDTGVPFYWGSTRPSVKSQSRGGTYSTSYWADQDKVIGACALPVRNYFVHGLTRSTTDPLEFLKSGPHPWPGGQRAMWCTAQLCHAAGRSIYQRGPGDYAALSPADAAAAGLADKRVDLFDFVPVSARAVDAPKVLAIEIQPASAKPNALLFRRLDKDDSYHAIMDRVLTNLLATLGRQEKN